MCFFYTPLSSPNSNEWDIWNSTFLLFSFNDILLLVTYSHDMSYYMF
jgi:hypothetical protein